MNENMIKITLYLNEDDHWDHRPSYIAILHMLKKKGISGGTVLHAVAGFTNRENAEITTLVDIDSKLPLVVEFIDTADKIEAILPELKGIVGKRLITREIVEVIV